MTGPIVRKSGCKSAQEYEEKVAEFSPMNYLPGTNAGKLISRFGNMDLLIPYHTHGKTLNSFLRNEMPADKKNIKTYFGADHCSALFLSSKFKINRYY